MGRMTMIETTMATGKTKDLLDKTQAQLGRIPNLYKAMANSSATLEGYLNFRSALSSGELIPQLREQIALLTASLNVCGYCVSAHVFRGQKVGLTMEELMLNRDSQSSNDKTAAALGFVKALIQKHGAIDDSDFKSIKNAGWADSEVGEMVAHVALNTLSNYFNHVALPDLDFPRVEATQEMKS